MKINFFKYQGTGNDFIIIDCRYHIIPYNNINFLKKLCNRHFGIGADGIILITDDKKNSKNDFYMKYYNSDGKESTMCGNGGRCAILFAKHMEISQQNMISFRAIDGQHYGTILKNHLVSIQMLNIDSNTIKINTKYIFLNTGSPHHIIFVKDIKNIDVNQCGKKIQFKNEYLEEGVNVNFVQLLKNNELIIRTYERGIEHETLSCGTGVVASVIASYKMNKINVTKKILTYTNGGKLWVSFIAINNKYKEIYLTGSTKLIFKGLINI
ncbi:diaminopimelate epimerase [Blattabacterium cuenoti]|uniref:diaminopimelate epimerase n=1 Tax=Blattabacterium cuenoti TaxID=1653831 RepID=UPI00163B9829|nr:diaminopimelate epimerase [Blattabacterium cuenoti]